ncbi:MAG: DNA topoisomerase III [Gammaproteobacteria bacterium]
MSKTLVIAEKPSVAADIARVLGAPRKNKDFFESDKYVVSSAVGHLLEIAAPEQWDVKRGKWTLAKLPVLPDYFDLTPITKSADRLKVLARLYKRRDVIKVVNACDAGREGELIFHKIARYIGAKKPVLRLWLSSMTTSAIREGFENLQSSDDAGGALNLPALQAAALSREEADWLVGINATRAITALHSTGGGFFLTPVGRVQTPTLAMIVEREKERRQFIVRDYWEVRARFAAQAGEYEGVYVQPKADKAEKKPERIFDKAHAKKVCAECRGKSGEVEEKKKPKNEMPPPLYDLTTLQREANARHGLPARATLAAAQALYERHKAITYPRTDSKYLPEDYPPVVAKTLGDIAKGGDDMAKFAARIAKEQWARGGNKRIYNNAKVSDHFAIIPTGAAPKPSWKEIETKVYNLILRRFLAVWYPMAKFEITERATTIAGHRFETRGRVLLEAGWREVAGAAKDALITPVQKGETVAVQSIDSEQKQTTPPPRYTEATLLSAMEGAGKLVDDEELREAMKERGLGTPATRAAIIEELLRKEYLFRDKRDLLPSEKAHKLMRLLHALKIESLTLPAMTGEWEYKLRQIERAERKREDFMDEIHKAVGGIVNAAKQYGDVEETPGDYSDLASPCPACGKAVRESHSRFSCIDKACGFFVWRTLAGREWSPDEMSQLLAKRELPDEISGFRSKKTGHEFSARVKLEKGDDGNYKINFVFDNSGRKEQTPEEMAQNPEVGDCPKCGAKVRDTGSRYVCGGGGDCDFSIYRRILKQELLPVQMEKLLRDGATDYLDGFVSKRTGRAFKARLAMDLSAKDGRFSFEFAPRAGKK